MSTPQGREAAALEVVKHRKLSTPLAQLARAVPQSRGAIPAEQKLAPPPGFSIAALPKSTQDAVRVGRMRINNDAEVQVYILVTEITASYLQQIRATGTTVELHAEKQGIVQARVPVSRLEEVTALPFVRSVRLPDYGLPDAGNAISEGDSVLRADQVRSMFGIDGHGVRIGVISDGIAGIFATGCTSCEGLQPPGPLYTDLPAQNYDNEPTMGTRDSNGVLISVSGGITAQSFRSDGDLEAGAEGTAMLEILADLSIDSLQYFANFETSLEFNQAVNFLAANADVVVDDISFIGGPYDGTSSVSVNTANALNDDANPIRAYFTSVGNQARTHYQEDFEDSGLDGDTSFSLGQPGNVHLFQATAETNAVFAAGPLPFDFIYLCGANNTSACNGVPAGLFDAVVVVLTWDDGFGTSGNDYDLFLVEELTGTVVASSTDTQDGDDFPIEFMVFTNTGDEGFLDIFIQNVDAAATVNFDMFILMPNGLVAFTPDGQNHNFNTVSSSVPAQSDAGGSPATVMSVGAAFHGTPEDIEPYSSNGPTNDGRLKPEIIGVDGVSVTGAGGFPSTFFGTSAAAPHAAAIAALLLQAHPCLVAGSAGARPAATARGILRDLLMTSAVDLGEPAADYVFGAGRLDALAAAAFAVPTANAGPNQTVSGTSSGGASVSLFGPGSFDPLGCPLTFSWTGGCGTASGATPTATCPLGTSTMSLTVTTNGVTISPSDSVQITVTDFSLGSSPASATVTPGQSATYTVTLSPKFGSYNRTVSLSCSGTPALSTCSLSPATLTPGSNAVTATLVVTTTAQRVVLGPRENRRGDEIFYAFWLGFPGMALFGLALAGRGPRKGARYLLLLMAVSVLLLQVACGGGGGSTPRVPIVIPGTPAGTSTITLTGAAGSLQRSATVTLTVQ